MYGKQTSNLLSQIVSRLGQGFGQFVLCVLLLNFLSTAALSANNNSVKDNLRSGVQSVVICTAQGLKQISLDENGNPVEDNKGHTEHCVCCHIFQKVDFEESNFEDSLPIADLITYKFNYELSNSIISEMPLDSSCPTRAPPYI